MTIEKSPAPTANHKPTASSASAGARAKAASGDASADAGATGFMSILGALGDAAPDASTPLTLADAALPADPTAGLSGPTPFDASTLLQQNPQIAAAQAAQLALPAASAEAADGVAGAVDSLGAQAVQTRLAPARALPSTSLAASASAAASAPLSAPLSASLPEAQPIPATVASTGPKPGEAASTASAAFAASTSATPLPDVAESATQGLQHAFSRAKAATALAQAGADVSASAANSTATSVAQRAEPNPLLAAMEQARAPSGAVVTEPVLAPLVFKSEKAQAERSNANGKSSEPTYSATSLGVNTPEYNQSAAAPVMAPEMQVAEQVSYWVAHNVQNAEMSLDGLGQSPVQVSISLQGNEAQISFRTDEAAARDVLQNAGVHLKDMLQREGLVLTGVSVGNSGSGNADGSERRARPNVRQTAIAPLQVARSDSGPRLRTASAGGAGRSVDLFV